MGSGGADERLHAFHSEPPADEALDRVAVAMASVDDPSAVDAWATASARYKERWRRMAAAALAAGPRPDTAERRCTTCTGTFPADAGEWCPNCTGRLVARVGGDGSGTDG